MNQNNGIVFDFFYELRKNLFVELIFEWYIYF